MALKTVPDSRFFEPNNKIKPTATNYKNLYNFTDQFFPHLKHELIKIWGNQNITGFLETFSMEEELTADTTYWSEDARRRRVHTGVTRATNVFTSTGHSIRTNDYILVSDKAGNKIEFGLVTSRTDDTFTAAWEGGAAWTLGTSNLIVIAVGSEFKKGTAGKQEALTRELSIYSTSPVIMKDMYQENGSDIPNIAWVYDPAGNAYWYIMEEQEAMYRFLDACESQLILQSTYDTSSTLTTSGYKGTLGLFPAIRSRGNNFEGFIAAISDMDDIVKRFDKINGEQYNAMFLTTEHSLAIDDLLASINQYDANAQNYGIFRNEESKEMIMKLGFKGFYRGGYQFWKQTWKFLKDATMYNPDNFGANVKCNGILVPMGMTSIRNQIEGNAIESVPFLTLMYKGKPGYSRKLETHFHGSVLVPDATDTLDVYGIDWRTERCLRPCGMIRWMLFEGTASA